MFFYRCLGHLPLGILYPLAWVVYLLLYYGAGYRKAVVRDNLEQAFPGQSAREITVLAKKFYRQFAQVALEIARARYMSAEEFQRRVEVLNPDVLIKSSEGLSRTVIVLTIHQGNWEWMLHGMTARLGVPLDPVYKPLHDPVADRFMREIRGRFGARPLSLKDATRDILRNRRQFRLLAMVADQSPIRREKCYWTQFLGRDAAFHRGAESLARSLGCPVVFAQCRRRRPGYYQIQLHPLAEPPYTSPEGDLTERYARMAETAIREEPESWLWSNRRWKRSRNGATG